MPVSQKVIKGLYRDSVSLMQCAASVQRREGVEQVGAMMATPANIDLAREAGLLGHEESVGAGPNDVLLLVSAPDATVAEDAFAEAQRILTEGPSAGGVGGADGEGEGGVRRVPPRSIRMAIDSTPDASLALISTPGDYAAAEARKALDAGLDAMIFSDNVSVADEIALKRLAHERGLLVMGPDCGTAIVGGIPLGFANSVRRGDIGCVGAAGTGLQQVTTLADRWGAGISHALGTGSHDLSAEVGGITMLDALAALEADAGTRVLLLVSKPPAAEVAEQVLAAAARSLKPSVVCFLGADPADVERPGIQAATTLDEAAEEAVAASLGAAPARAVAGGELDALADEARAGLAPRQRYVRGLYSGGTFGYEASLLLSAEVGRVWSNTPARPEDRIDDVWKSREHTVIDLGDDVFTRGRPHPMIDYRLRVERIAEEAADPEVAVVLLDVVLGFGSHPDPAAELVPAIEDARRVAESGGRRLAFVGQVCGTDSDPQSLAATEARLRDAGVLLAESNARAVALAARIVRGREVAS